MNQIKPFQGCRAHKEFDFYCHACLVTTVGILAKMVDVKLTGDENGMMLTDDQFARKFNLDKSLKTPDRRNHKLAPQKES